MRLNKVTMEDISSASAYNMKISIVLKSISNIRFQYIQRYYKYHRPNLLNKAHNANQPQKFVPGMPANNMNNKKQPISWLIMRNIFITMRPNNKKKKQVHLLLEERSE